MNRWHLCLALLTALYWRRSISISWPSLICFKSTSLPFQWVGKQALAVSKLFRMASYLSFSGRSSAVIKRWTCIPKSFLSKRLSNSRKFCVINVIACLLCNVRGSKAFLMMLAFLPRFLFPYVLFSGLLVFYKNSAKCD